MSELQYSPNHYDDWGMIRNADGTMHATVSRPEASDGEFAQHRAEETDPFAELARKIIFFDDIEAENHRLRTALSEADQRVKDARREAMEEAALWHEKQIKKLDEQIEKNTLSKRSSAQVRAEANKQCRYFQTNHRLAASAIRALIPSETHDAEVAPPWQDPSIFDDAEGRN